jgi:hypothetical protein
MNEPLHALQHAGERTAFVSIDGPIEELRLAPIPMGRNDESSCYVVSYLGPKVAADQMQAEIEPCRTPGGRENLALVNVEHVRVHTHLRVTTL